ncbi:MAG: hypothetical protein JNM66_22465 [Bryobacterales bacterium]|nr:hypothetical protein [Bryobacterales bacterium]
MRVEYQTATMELTAENAIDSAPHISHNRDRCDTPDLCLRRTTAEGAGGVPEGDDGADGGGIDV